MLTIGPLKRYLLSWVQYREFASKTELLKAAGYLKRAKGVNEANKRNLLVLSEFEESVLQELNNKEILDLGFVMGKFYSSSPYPLQNSLGKLLSKIKLSQLNFPEVITLSSHLKHICKQGFPVENSNFLQEFKIKALDCLEDIGVSKPKFLFSFISTVKEIDPKFNMKEFLAEVSAKHSTKEALQKLSYDEIHYLLSSYLRALYPHDKKEPVPTPEEKDLFDLAAEVIEEKLETETPKIVDAYNLARIYVMMDKHTEDFRRKLENILFNNLKELPADKFLNLPYCYRDRIVHDHQYMIKFIWKSIYDSFLERIDSLELKSISIGLFRLWWSPGRYGHYFDNKIIPRLFSLLDRIEEIADDPLNKIDCCLNILSYLTQSGYFDNPGLLKKVTKTLFKYQSYITISQVLHISGFLAKHNNVPEDFWKLLSQHLPKILQDRRNHSLAYSVVLNLRLQQPQIYQKYAQQRIEPYIQQLKKAWKNDRDKDLKQSKTSHMHALVEEILQKEGLEYEKEYFEEFYLDIAIPQHKVAIEIVGPSHYVYPGLSLNGRTLNKQRNLEKLGWKVVYISFYMMKEPMLEESIKHTIRSKLAR